MVIRHQHFLNMLPLQPTHRYRILRNLGPGVPLLAIEHHHDLVGIGGFGKVMGGSQLDRFDGRRDTGVAGENDNVDLVVMEFQILDKYQSRRSGHIQIDYGVLRRVLPGRYPALFNRVRDTDIEAALDQGTREYQAKDLVIIDLLLASCSSGSPTQSAETGESNETTVQRVFGICGSGAPLELPCGFPLPREDATNPLSIEKIARGRLLFYDRNMSFNQTQSCGDCHLQEKAFTDGLTVSIGSEGHIHPRNAMTMTMTM